MGAQDTFKARASQPDSQHGRHESNESHEGYESQEGLCAAGQASRLRWEVNKDAKWAEEIRFGEKQVGQNCQQEEECPFQSQPLDCCLQGGAGGIEDQGLRRHQEGFPALQQGKGTLQKEVIRCGYRIGAHGSSTVDNTSCC